jgi:pimeloyl-ACP methyl ester carboxylesterase
LAKPLVFVHGFACTHADWQPLAAQFSDRHPVYAPDLRGHGATHARPEDCSIETFGGDVAALLDGKDLNGAVLVGHSMGCRVVLQACLNAPERVAALVLVDGSFQPNRPPVTIEEYPGMARKMFEHMFFVPSDLATTVVDRAVRLPASIGTSLLPRMGRWDAENMERALAAVTVPMLVIQTTSLQAGGKRVVQTAAQSSPWLDMVRRCVPQAKIEVLSGPGHFPQLEVPEKVASLLSEFIGA